MPPIAVDPSRIHEFPDAASFYLWLSANHDTQPEIWIKIHKVNSGLPSITPKEAIDAALCWGWIDAIRKSFDANSFLQRYTPRGRKSIWSQINVDNVARLIAYGRMTPHGLREVDAAKADGRWHRAYRSGKDMELPADLLAAIAPFPEAQKTLESLNAQNRFALAFRLHNMRTPAGRKKKVEAFTEMLKRGETLHPQRKK